MPETNDPKKAIGRFFNYANNGLTIVGIVLTSLSAVVIITFMVVELFGELENPYIGLFAYVVMPVLFVLGLILIPTGMWRRRKNLIRDGATATEQARFPKLDFNDPKIRRAADHHHRVDRDQRGDLRRELVHRSGENGVRRVLRRILSHGHATRVHRLPTIAPFSGRLRQVSHRSRSLVVREIETRRSQTGLAHRPQFLPPAGWNSRSKLSDPARETCEQCHWPGKHFGDKLRVVVRHATDEANTPSYTAMLLKTGGGSLDIGRHGGIHWWHIESDNVIRYVPGDERNESVVWVELTTADGEVRTYTRDGEELPADVASQARTMDCIDCHNRPTHLFSTPPKALDWVLETHPELLRLPYFKKQAKTAIEAEYATHAEGVAAVRDSMLAFYQNEYPELVAENARLVDDGADLASRVYARISFPEMNTNWETHPNHIGHDDFPGCWRCHDDEMATADGEHVIPMDCENCHVFLVEDAPEPPDLASLINGS